MSHPLARPRWLVGTVIVLVVAALFVNLGFWQLRRLDERRAENAKVVARSRRIVPVPDAAWRASKRDAQRLEYTFVRLRGRFDASREVLVRFQTRDGQPGYDVVTPFLTEEGAVLVERGWVPGRLGDEWPVPEAAPPPGEIDVEGLLAAPDDTEARLEVKPDRPVVVSGVQPSALAGALGLEKVLPLYVRAVGGDPDAYPIPSGEPDLSEGPHMSYAIQWFAFAVVVGGGWIVLLLRTARQRST